MKKEDVKYGAYVQILKEELVPAWVTTVFGKSPVVVTTIVAILLNLILPKDKKQ